MFKLRHPHPEIEISSLMITPKVTHFRLPFKFNLKFGYKVVERKHKHQNVCQCTDYISMHFFSASYANEYLKHIVT